MRIFSSLVVAATIVAVSACDKSNPVAPAAASAAAPAAAQTIQMKGVVQTIGNGSFTVAGQTVMTNASTRFLLDGAAAGPSALVAGRHVDVEGTSTSTGAVMASSVSIESEQEAEHPVPDPQPEPKPEPEAELKGPVQNLTGSPASFQFQINGSLITGNGSTMFDRSQFTDLKNGAIVEVKGSSQAASILATRIHVEEVNEPAPPQAPAIETEFTGLLTSKTGTSPVFTLVVGGRTVHTTAATTFRRDGDSVDPNVLQTGMTLEVEGTQRADGSIDAGKITLEEAEDAEVRVQGTVSGLTGVCPAIQFTVNGATVITTSSTDFRTSCGALQNTSTVEVRGLRLSNGNVSATRVEKK